MSLIPVNNPVSAVVEFSHIGNIDSVFVAGQPRKRNGKLARRRLPRLPPQGGRRARRSLRARRRADRRLVGGEALPGREEPAVLMRPADEAMPMTDADARAGFARHRLPRQRQDDADRGASPASGDGRHGGGRQRVRRSRDRRRDLRPVAGYATMSASSPTAASAARPATTSQRPSGRWPAATSVRGGS